jgi:glucose-6-phosphate isomerase
MANRTITPIQYDYDGVLIGDHGLTADDLGSINTKLEDARREVLETDARLYQTGEVPTDKAPLDAAFLDMPERLLGEYEAKRADSELGQILATAQRLADTVDRVVLLGIGGSYMGARALMEGCCHPYHNELSRAARGGRPRMYFEGNNVDNDACAALLDLLATGSNTDAEVENEWGVVVISKSGGTLETAVSFRLFLEALAAQGKSDRLSELVVPVTGHSGKLFDLAKAIGCQDIFYVPDGVGGRFSILSAVGLLPAAILGIDIVRLLRVLPR